jgi:hypothetical protein
MNYIVIELVLFVVNYIVNLMTKCVIMLLCVILLLCDIAIVWLYACDIVMHLNEYLHILPVLEAPRPERQPK